MEKRIKNVVVRVTEQELEVIKINAKEVGLSISSYLRMLGLK